MTYQQDMTWVVLLLSATLISGIGGTSEATGPVVGQGSISGQVLDESGRPIADAVISVRGAVALAISGSDGRFSIAATAPTTLLVAMPGFATAEVTMAAGTTTVRVVLSLAVTTVDVVVRAPVMAQAPDALLVLRPIDVVRTAGAQGDVMRAIAAMPGVARVDEGAGLFVRGGDVSETRVLLDGAVINHPYRYETPTGGFRGAVDPFLTQGMSFSTGGFSAEYANSLSGVLDMRGQDRPTATRATGTAGLAGLAGSVGVPFGERAGFRLAANRTTPGLLFAVNPSPREFSELPHGWDVSGSAHLNLVGLGVVRAFVIEQRDGVGVALEQDAFKDFLHSSTAHRLLVADWRGSFGNRWAASAVLGLDQYSSGTDVGVLALTTTDLERSLRLDVGRPVGAWQFRAGVDLGLSSTSSSGMVPTRGGDFGGVNGVSPFDVEHRDARAGGYVESSRAIGRVTPTLGLRVDRYDHAEAWRADPRVNISIDAGFNARVRVAWGQYHQAPSPRYFDRARGANSLGPMAATHYIVGYEVGRISDAWFFRVEAYLKTYRDLPVDDGLGGLRGDGYGHARGADLFVRRVWHFIDVRASVSFVDASRRWTAPEQRNRYPVPDGTWTPDFAIPFTGQLNVTVPVWKTVAVGASWRSAAGRPVTPVIGAIETAAGFQPVWGSINSERVPRYERFDLSISHTRTIGARGLAIFYASVDNALDRRNFFEYVYSSDFQQRRPVSGAAPRGFYIGCSITR